MKNKNIIKIITTIIVLIGIVMLIVTGFNKSIIYEEGTRLEIALEKGYNNEDIEKIVRESFQNKEYLIQDIEKLNQVVSIKLQSYTDEELENFKSKIAEKYEINSEDLVLYEIEVPATRIRTIINPYVLPVGILTILVLVYIGIRNIKKEKPIKNVTELLTLLIGIAGLYFSIIVISRISFNEYTMPVALMVYLITLLLGAIKVNNK